MDRKLVHVRHEVVVNRVHGGGKAGVRTLRKGMYVDCLDVARGTQLAVLYDVEQFQKHFREFRNALTRYVAQTSFV